MNDLSQPILDEAWVLAWQAGDRQAFAPLVERWQPRLLRYLIGLTGQADAAGDIAQDVWVSAVRDLHRLDDPAAFPGWLFRIAHRRSADWVRKQQRRRRHFRRYASTRQSMPATHEELSRDIDHDTAMLHAGIEMLSTDQREALICHHLRQQPIADIAEAMGLPAGTIKSRLYHARKQLKRYLQRERNSA